MVDFISLLGIGIGAFAATDIDDLFVLMLFFSQPTFTARQVVLGQYVGIVALIAISAVASLISLVLPAELVALMGLLPIAIGIKKMIDSRKDEDDDVKDKLQKTSPRVSYLQFVTVASVTFANGGDNLGVYVPLFTSGGLNDMAILITIFLAITGLWCVLAYYLVKHRLLAGKFSRVARTVLPLVLIGLGIFIIVDGLLLA